jgi:GAF domain-containing protein
MKRRSKAGDKAGKSPRRETVPLKRRRIPPKAVPGRRSATTMQREIAHITRERDEALEQQTATSALLSVISRSNFDLHAVLQSVIDTAARLCRAEKSVIFRLEQGVYRFAAAHGVKPAYLEIERTTPILPGPGTLVGRVAMSRQVVRIDDVLIDPLYEKKGDARIGGFRSAMGVPLMRDNEAIGVLGLGRSRVEPFSDREIELTTTFADQAVIAIENARLFEAEQQRTQELTESLEQQTATAKVLQVISRSTFDLQTVLSTLVESAARLCLADQAALFLRDGDVYRIATTYGYAGDTAKFADMPPLRPDRTSMTGRVALEGKAVHVHDVLADPEYRANEYQQAFGYRTNLGAPLLRDGTTIGVFALVRTEVNPFSEKQIELVTTFADQAVIAIENARLLNELRQRTDDLSESLQQQTATSDVLKVISRSAFDLQGVFDTLISSAVELSGAFNGTICLRDGDGYRYLATAGIQGEFRKYLSEHPPKPGRASAAGRVLLSGEVVSVPDVLKDPDYIVPAFDLNKTRSVLGVPLLREDKVEGALVLARVEPGLFTQRHIDLVQSFADQAVIAIENVRLFDEVQARTKELSLSLEELRTAQDRLIQTEKLASLGQLTAGIAHEIKNPLNFVNNFSGVSVELIDELQEALHRVQADDETRSEIGELADTLRDNLGKIVQHGRRADAIVKNMLLHSREGSGEHRSVDINAIVEEALNLAYHGARAEKQDFAITLQRSFDPEAGQADVFPQDITRALLNLISNSLYAATRRKSTIGSEGFQPTVSAATRSLGDRVEIGIRDNGIGIPPEVKDKMFNPFFTTKPAGEGTGLGLSISYDIVVKQHAGLIEVDTEPGEFTEIRIILPRSAAHLPPQRA